MELHTITGAPVRRGNRAPFSDPAPIINHAAQPLPQSGMGITSFVIALLGCISIAMMVIVIVSVDRSAPEARTEGSPMSYLIGTWMVGSVVLCLCGIVFGIGGVRQRQRRHDLAWLGLIGNIFLPLSTLFLMLLAVTFYGAIGHPGPAEPLGAPDPADWSSTPSRLLRWATLALAIVIALYYGKKHQRRRAPASVPNGGFVFCTHCRKAIPRTSRFCRRCGNTVA